MTQTTTIQTCDWPGVSGSVYTYHVYDINFVLNAGQDGNYIFAKLVNGSWSPVYIGQGDLQSRRQAHLNDGCVTQKGATHFHCHLNGSEIKRLAEERDILANFPSAYRPTGCNVKPGGSSARGGGRVR